MDILASAYPEIHQLLKTFTEEIQKILSADVVGIYLFGSLTYDDFKPDRSDIDVVVITKKTLTTDQFEDIKKIQEKITTDFPTWSKRLEISYTPLELFKEIQPPTQPRPYFGEGIFYPEAQYGNEWMINNYLLYQYGISLTGPEFKALVEPIKISDVQKASLQDLFREWEPKLQDSEWLNNPHYQSYLVLNLCRILNTVIHGKVESKTASAEWVKTTYPQWVSLINSANDWIYGQDFDQKQEALDFLHFTIKEVKKTPLYQTLTR